MMQTRFSLRLASQPFNGHNVSNLFDRKRKLERSYLRTEQEEAFKEMIKVIGANGGRV
jgi:hypothetical protein